MGTPSHKGQFSCCNGCIHNKDIGTKYPCTYAHRIIKNLENEISYLRRNIDITTFICKNKAISE